MAFLLTCAAYVAFQYQATAAGPPAGFDLDSASVIREGETRFQQKCSVCHGAQGDSGRSRSLRQSTLEPAELFDVVRNGRKRGSNVMPSYQSAFSDEEIWQIVAYMRSLQNARR